MFYLNFQYPKFGYCDKLDLCYRRSKTKNFLSISFSASRRRGGGRRREKNARKFFGFCTRESASVSEARIIGRQGLIQNTFELRSIHTAKIRNQKKRTKRGRAEGATLMHSPRRIQNPKGFSTLRVARRLPIQIYE